MRAMVLAAGFGTRLRPLTEKTPKPLLPVANRPILEYTFALLAGGGVEEVMVNTHHLPEVMANGLREIDPAGMAVHLSREKSILGTAGGPKKAAAFLDGGTFILCNGDFLIDLDLKEVLDFHRRRGAAATMVLRDDPAGRIFVDDKGTIRRFLEPGDGAGEGLRPMGFTGIHILEPRVFGMIPRNSRWEINLQVYPAMKERGWPIFGFRCGGYWREAGNPADYLRANMELIAGRAGSLAPLGGAGTLNPPGLPAMTAPVLLGEGAVVEEGAAVGPGVVLGPQALVCRGASVREAVVHEGALVPAGRSLEKVILSPETLLEAGDRAD